MQVFLAGYNIDAEVIAELSAGQSRQDLTPETLSASYARISRDPRPINELRRIARQEVEKARRSNSNIIFKMGHHSVAEHAVFNFDVIGLSRLALEELERFRLCSYTEKSQRYQKLEGDYHLPAELRGTKWEEPFKQLVTKQNNCYAELLKLGSEPEDARYITSLATNGQVGLTINARNLELLIRRFACSQLNEVRTLGEEFYRLAAKIAPSIILFTAANEYDQQTYSALAGLLKGKWERKEKPGEDCLLVDLTPQADQKLLTALVYAATGLSFTKCRRLVRKLAKKERLALIKKACEKMEFYDAVLREFEHISLTYDLICSSSCFGQLKRHRMATLTSQPYEIRLGVTLPPKIRGTKGEPRFKEVIAETNQFYEKLVKEQPAAAPYILTGAHRRRVLLTINLRELYHISRLREDAHAQWEIQQLSAKMSAAAKRALPLGGMLLGGKDRYAEIYTGIYGRPPKILPPV